MHNKISHLRGERSYIFAIFWTISVHSDNLHGYRWLFHYIRFYRPPDWFIFDNVYYLSQCPKLRRTSHLTKKIPLFSVQAPSGSFFHTCQICGLPLTLVFHAPRKVLSGWKMPPPSTDKGCLRTRGVEVWPASEDWASVADGPATANPTPAPGSSPATVSYQPAYQPSGSAPAATRGPPGSTTGGGCTAGLLYFWIFFLTIFIPAYLKCQKPLWKGRLVTLKWMVILCLCNILWSLSVAPCKISSSLPANRPFEFSSSIFFYYPPTRSVSPLPKQLSIYLLAIITLKNVFAPDRNSV